MEIEANNDVPWFIYIVQCNDNSLYTGITNNLEKRLKAHNGGKDGAKYTRSRRPVEIVFSQEYPSRSAAAKQEYRLKQMTVSEKRKIISNCSQGTESFCD